jgi:carbonic anhydrase/acetyltransferase-like protein (isoleucine patch superfamily)
MQVFRQRKDGSYHASTAMVIGEVHCGEHSNFWFGAVVRGDVAPITIGRRTNVQDNAVIHCDSGIPNIIGDDVTIGHSAVVHGKSVGDGTLIGMGAKVLGRTVIGKRCLIAAGAVVPPGLVVPDEMMVMGVPGKILRPVKPEEFEYMKWLSAHYVQLAEKYLAGTFEMMNDE